MTIKYVAQKHKSGCAVACMAMILDFDYDFIDSQFLQDFNKSGINKDPLVEYFTFNGLGCIAKIPVGFDQILIQNKEMLKPFADIHFVSIRQAPDTKLHHAVVMDNKGRIYDPDNKDRKKLTTDYAFEISYVLGLYYPRPRVYGKKKNGEI
jgi:hypothetical protein